MEKKIVLLFEIPPVVTYARRYDYQTLIDAGYQLDVCDMSGLISVHHSMSKNRIDDKANVENHSFYERIEFEKYIDGLSKGVFIWSTFQLTAEYYWIFKIISNHYYGFICNIDYVLPRSELRKKEKSYWTKWSLSRIANAVLYRIPRRWIPVRKADAVITYGLGDEQRKLNNVLYDAHTVVELTNTIDYNECTWALEQMAEDDINDLPKNYIVFIDEYMPYHPDGLMRGKNIDAAKYYLEVETFLFRISNLMGLPVVIAAHPKADYKKHSECYRGMQVIQFKTNELIQRASFVVTHLSIAISMVLVCRKSYMLITTDDVENKIYIGGVIEDYENNLKCKVINISTSLSDENLQIEINKAQSMSTEYYDEQILKYKLPDGHPNEQRSFGEIMIKAMKRVEAGESKKI